MGYNVSQEVIAAFREKQAWQNFLTLKKLKKTIIVLSIIAVLAFFVGKGLMVRNLRNEVVGLWKFGNYDMELLNDGRYALYNGDGDIMRGRYIVESLLMKSEIKKFSSGGFDLSYYGELEKGDVKIGFLTSDDEPLLLGVYNPYKQTIHLYQDEPCGVAYRMD